MLVYTDNITSIVMLVEPVIGAKCSSNLKVCRVVRIIKNPLNLFTFPGAELELARNNLTLAIEPQDCLKNIL